MDFSLVQKHIRRNILNLESGVKQPELNTSRRGSFSRGRGCIHKDYKETAPEKCSFDKHGHVLDIKTNDNCCKPSHSIKYYRLLIADEEDGKTWKM